MGIKNIICLLSLIIQVSGCSSGAVTGLPVIGSLVGQNEKDKKDKRDKRDGVADSIPKIGAFENIDGIDEDDTDPSGQSENYDGIDTNGWHPALSARISNGAPYGFLICAKGQDALKYTDYDDFSDLFNAICSNRNPNKNFADILSQSATATVDPKISVLKLSIDKEMYITDFIYAFAVKVPVDSPKDLASYPIYDEIAKGLKTTDSELQVKKVKETIFPGRGVVRSIEQNYFMPLAKGAALYDKRSTLTNTYLIVEGSTDLNFSAEHLVGAADFYNASRQIIFGIKGESPGTTYIVYITQLVVINRFDPQRLTVAATELASLIPKAVLRVVKKK